MIDTTVSGSGVAELLCPRPDGKAEMAKIDETIWIFLISKENVNKLRQYLKTTKETIRNVCLMAIDSYEGIEVFEEGLREFIKYGIFENQKMCETSYCLCTTNEQVEVAAKVIKEEQRHISKFVDKRLWPQDGFKMNFIPIEGDGGISHQYDDPNPPEFVSWIFEIGHSRATVTNSYGFDPVKGPDYNVIPRPTHGLVFPDYSSERRAVQSAGSGEGSVTPSYEVIYYYEHEYVSFPFEEMHSKPMGQIVASRRFGSNTLHIDHWKMSDIKIVEIVTDTGDSGGGE